MSTTAGGGQGRESGSFIIMLVVVLFLSLGALITNFILANIRNTQDRAAIALATDIQVKSQQLAKFATEAAGGNLDAFEQMAETQRRINANISALRNGNGQVQPISSNPQVLQFLTALETSWASITGKVTGISERRDQIVELNETATAFAEQMLPLSSRSDQLTSLLTESGAPTDQVYIAGRQVALAERMNRRLTEIVQAGPNAEGAADGFGRDARIFGRVLDGLLRGNPDIGINRVNNAGAQDELSKMSASYNQISQSVDTILGGSQELFDVKISANEIFVDSEQLLKDAEVVAVRYGEQGGRRLFPSLIVALIAGLLAGLAVLALGYLILRDQQRRLKITADLNQRNQEAILRLLDEMGSLAEGDLTVRATVTEDITGAIADSINFAVEALRSLVTTINETAVQVAAAAQETQATAMHLAEAAEHQAQQITSASAAINEIAVSIDEVSKNSAESADVAQRSVQIAGKGAAIVRQTIQGMDNIREQIQETSKRIKRLGESSQEIGSIVELINDIAEQTNILALNAAIQAASAGEAGRGFAVVADEVQRLAERASNATKRIETLVQTIQSDTNEAVSSMEQTTSEVVSGARLAEDAGLALGEIEKVSNDLADLIQNISSAARQQSAAATNISATMNVIQEITTQTSVGASQTAESIGNLAQLAADLRRSVADFKLPT
jgi:twitching motility protein PilJ